MKKNSIKSKLLPLIFLLLTLNVAEAQQIDTVIVNDVYISYFSYQYHNPLYVVYKVYQGGGDCDRKAFHFKTGNLPNSATPADYKGSGYDEGHLADAKDFASDCFREEETFRFYNCVPQTPKLNRGIWKHFETEIRKLSQNDSVLVICGSIFGNKTMGPDNIAIPEECWKLVFSLSTKKKLYAFTCPNDDSNSFIPIEVDDLKKRLNYKVVELSNFQ